MCIRDRYDSFNGIDEAAKTDFYKHDQNWSNRMILGDSLQAVSYTHLRAHETVLDLVCRLLLEKKNNECSIRIIITSVRYHEEIRNNAT